MKLTCIFAFLAMLELFIGMYAEIYMPLYQGSFFEKTLPVLFIMTISMSIFFNIKTVLIKNGK